MKKKALSLLLALALIMTLLPTGAVADAPSGIMAYVTISVAGLVPIGTDKTDSDKSALMALTPIAVTDQNGNGKFDIDDALHAAHTRYSLNGTGDYSKSSSNYLAKLWGTTSGVGGYYVNDSIVNANLYSEIQNGDRIAAFTYADTSGWSDSYAFFNRSNTYVATGGALKLMLRGSTWNGTSPIIGAQLELINSATGTKTNIDGRTTDASGGVSLSFNTEGKYCVSAAPASGHMTAPVCKVNVLSAETAGTAIQTDKEALTLPASVTSDITLPDVGASGKTIVTWASADTSVISASGKVSRSTSESKSATLTATIGIPGAASITKEFNIAVPQAEASEIATAQTAISAVISALTFSVIKGTNKAPYAIDGNLYLPSFATYDVTGGAVSFSSESGDFEISWSSKNSAIESDGKTTQGSGDVSGTVTATIHCKALGGIVSDQTAAFSLSVLNYNYYGTLSNSALCNIVAGNIAKSYQQSVDTSNYAWVIADMASANAAKAYGNSGYPNFADIAYNLTAAQKQAYVDYAIGAMSQDNVTESELAKNIIGLAAIGCDARKLTTSAGVSFDALSKLTAKVGSETSIYNLPYMLIALQQFGTTYQTQIDTLINKIVGTKNWGYDKTDADGAGPALLALAQYYGSASYTNVTDAVDKQIKALKNNVTLDENGTVSFFGTKSAESTALLIAGLCAVGQDVTAFNEKNLVSGLLSMVDNSGKGFVSAVYDSKWTFTGYSLNSIATEQGFRGLIASSGSAVSGFRLYDFSGKTLAPATATWYNACPVTFSVIPSDAQVTVTGQTAVYGNCFNLAAGSYDYTVSKEGYTSKFGTLTVSNGDATNHTLEIIYVSLPTAPTGSTTCTVSFTLVGDTDHDDEIKHIYKQDGGTGRTWLAAQSLSTPTGSRAFDVFDKALTQAGYQYHELGESYIRDIVTPAGVTLSDFDNGKKSGWMYIVNGASPSVGLRDYKVSNGDSIVFFYTDDYTNETGSEQWIVPTETTGSNGTIIPSVTAQSGKAEATVDSKSIKSALSQNNGKVLIAPKITGWAESVSVSIPATSLKEIAENASGTLSVQSDCGCVSIPNCTLDSVSEQAGGSDIKMTIATKSAKDIDMPAADLENAAIVEISISSGGKNITTFGGGSLGVSITVADSYKTGDSYKVIVISADGTVETLVGQVVINNGKASVEVTVKHLSTFIVTDTPIVLFDDVNTDTWYYDAVQYVTQKGMMKGVSETTFAPNAEMSRAMIVAVLYRLEGNPIVADKSAYTDIENGQWYTDAVIWASKNQIVEGYGDRAFGVNDIVTREQLATVLYRYSKYKSLDMTKTTSLEKYVDAGAIGDFAQSGMNWANAEGLITGTSANTLDPKGMVTRAQAATVLMRYCENTKK